MSPNATKNHKIYFNDKDELGTPLLKVINN